jgi:hypothetical protein
MIVEGLIWARQWFAHDRGCMFAPFSASAYRWLNFRCRWAIRIGMMWVYLVINCIFFMWNMAKLTCLSSATTFYEAINAAAATILPPEWASQYNVDVHMMAQAIQRRGWSVRKTKRWVHLIELQRFWQTKCALLSCSRKSALLQLEKRVKATPGRSKHTTVNQNTTCRQWCQPCKNVCYRQDTTQTGQEHNEMRSGKIHCKKAHNNSFIGQSQAKRVQRLMKGLYNQGAWLTKTKELV